MKLLNTKQVIDLISRYSFKKVHIHHTWKPNHANFNGNNHIILNENMKRYHVHTNGWSDIAQHLTLFPDGKWVTGRPLNKTPASISGHNTGALCIEMVGDFDIGKDKFEGEQKASMMKVANSFGNRYGFETIMFHNEASNKTCPGTSIKKDKFVSDARALNIKPSEVVKLAKEHGKIQLRVKGKLQNVPGEIIKGTSYIYIGTTLTPLREACEGLGLIVGWDAHDKVVLID